MNPAIGELLVGSLADRGDVAPFLVELVDGASAASACLEISVRRHDELKLRSVANLEADMEHSVPENNFRRLLDVENSFKVSGGHLSSPTGSTEHLSDASGSLNGSVISPVKTLFSAPLPCRRTTDGRSIAPFAPPAFSPSNAP